MLGNGSLNWHLTFLAGWISLYLQHRRHTCCYMYIIELYIIELYTYSIVQTETRTHSSLPYFSSQASARSSSIGSSWSATNCSLQNCNGGTKLTKAAAILWEDNIPGSSCSQSRGVSSSYHEQQQMEHQPCMVCYSYRTFTTCIQL